MEIKKINENRITIKTDVIPFIDKEKNCKWEKWAYSLNTTDCLYHKGISDKLYGPESLYVIDQKGEREIMRNVEVISQDYYKYFMILYLADTKEILLIDLENNIYDVSQFFDLDFFKYNNSVSVINDKRDGVLFIDTYGRNNLQISYRSKEQQSTFEKQSKPDYSLKINKEFNRFMIANSKNNNFYLYVSGGSNKRGAMIEYFIRNGMEYEIIPNIFIDDESINFRIPLNEKNLERIDVQYLLEKNYANTYSCLNVPFNEICGLMKLDNKVKNIYSHSFYTPKEKEKIVFSIINSLRALYNTTDDYEIYKKTFKKVVNQFEKNRMPYISTSFSEKKLKHPSEVDEEYFQNKKQYINDLLFMNGSKDHFDDLDHFFYSIYYDAYRFSKDEYKKAISQFESSMVIEMKKIDKRITRWKSETELYILVSKLYPDAIYQYHASWLGLQSLDIYVPSLKLGLEYQGKQHYEPIDYFGGKEAFKEVKRRDEQKQILCKKNNVRLICWKYDELMTIGSVKKMINQKDS